MLPRIVHLTGDFPDPVDPAKTHAIRRLVDLTDGDFAHRVISLNRCTPPLAAMFPGASLPPPIRQQFEYGDAMRYFAPPRGLRHVASLDALGQALGDWITVSGAKPDLIVGHKLTIEGIVAQRLAQRFAVPYALSLQGNTDLKILTARPDLRSLFGRIYHEAAVVFAFAPWARDGVERLLGPRVGETHLLPCALETEAELRPRLGTGEFVTAFHLQNWRTKNFDRLVRAHGILAAHDPATRLTVVGGGDAASEARCRALARTMPGIAFAGAVPNARMAERLNPAIAFVMPSRRESFGMVFIEALLAGTPIIYPRGQAVDGYFDGLPFALAVDPSSPAAIAEAMVHAKQNEADLKAALAQWRAEGGLAPFMRAAIARTFASGLHRTLHPTGGSVAR